MHQVPGQGRDLEDGEKTRDVFQNINGSDCVGDRCAKGAVFNRDGARGSLKIQIFEFGHPAWSTPIRRR
jgi:hypothetical protein